MAIHIPVQCISRDDDFVILVYKNFREGKYVKLGVIGVVPSKKEIELLVPKIDFEVNEDGQLKISKSVRDAMDRHTGMVIGKYMRVRRVIMTYLEQEKEIPDNFAYNA